MKFVSLVPSYLRVPGSKFRRHGHLRLPLTMLAVASLALSSLLFLAPIPVQAAAPSVTTGTASDIEQTTATLNGSLDDLGGEGEEYECEVWFEYGETTSYGNSTTHQDMSSTGSFSDGISGLSPGVTYYFRAVADNVDGTSYGGDQQFTTAAETYTLTTSHDPFLGGSVTTPGEGTFGPYDDGDIVNLVAQPNLLWEFTEWTGDVDTVDARNAAETFITMHGDYDITAEFAFRAHTLTIASSGGGSVTDPGEGTFARGHDEVVPLLAEPTANYAFTEWTGDVGMVGDVNAADTTITMQGDYSITANFAPLRALTIAVVGSGSTSPPAGLHYYAQGTEVAITATPESGWQFDDWTNEVTDIADPSAAFTTIEMNASYYIIANFSEITDPTYTLTVEWVGSGEATPPWGEHEIPQGDTVSITANANAGWTFVNWTSDDEDALAAVADVDAASTTITMDAPYSITANFALIRTLTIEVVGSGSTTPPAGTHEQVEGAEVDITATPLSGWQFDGWTGETVDIAAPSAVSTEITMNASYYITANFVEVLGDTYTLTVAFTGEGITEPSPGENVYAQGGAIGIVATPAQNWVFGGWTGTGVDAGAVDDPTGASTLITMNGDYSITANFVRADGQEVTASEDTPTEITLTASGLNGDPLTFSIVDAPAHGQLSGAVPNLTYIPNEGYSGSDSFTFRVFDGTSYSNIATVTITVEPAATEAETNSGDIGVPPWVWILLAGGSIIAGAIALLVMERRSATE